MNSLDFFRIYWEHLKKEYINTAPPKVPIEIDRFVFELSVYMGMMDDIKEIINKDIVSNRKTASLKEISSAFIAVNIRKFISWSDTECKWLNWLLSELKNIWAITWTRYNTLNERMITLRENFKKKWNNPNKSIIHRDSK